MTDQAPTTTAAKEDRPASGSQKPPVLDLDTLDREDAPAPYDFVHKGVRYLLTDPSEVDWQDLISALRSPQMFFKLVLTDDDGRRQFFSAPMPSWKMRRLMESYSEHFGIPDLPNVAGLLR